MTVSLTTRLGIHRWTDDEDPWDRADFDADNVKLEQLAVIGTQGLGADRPAAGVERRLYLATDTDRVYLDDGGAWLELLVSGNAPASAIVFNPSGDVIATNVQAAIAELAAEKATAAALTAHTGATTGAHAATAISYAGSTNLSSTNVEAALDELDAEKLALAGGTVTGLVTFNSSPALANGVDLTVGTGTGSKIGQAASKLGFFGATPAARPGTYTLAGSADRTLGAYASDPESSTYSADPAALTDALTKTDGNALRVAYENLRVYVEDLAGIVIGTATDLKTLGLVG